MAGAARAPRELLQSRVPGVTRPDRMEGRGRFGPDRLAAAARHAADRAPVLVLGKKAPRSGGGTPGTIAYRVLSRASVPVLMFVD